MDSDYKTLPDNTLLQLLKESDHSAFNEIYQRYFHLLYAHAYKKLRDQEQAKDVIQDVFTSLWFNRETSNPTNLSAYLFTAVRYKIFDLFGRQQSATKYVDSLRDYMEKHQPIATDALIREKQLQAYIDEEVAKLPGKMKRVFEMSRNEGLSRKEISSQLNISESSVSKNLSLALKILKAKLSIALIVWQIFG